MSKMYDLFEKDGTKIGTIIPVLHRGNIVILRTYEDSDIDQITKYTPSKLLRNHQLEFAVCARFASLTLYALGGLQRFVDYNLMPILTGIGKKIMNLDEFTDYVGERRLLLSEHKELLEGIIFNHKIPYDTMLLFKPAVKFNWLNLNILVTIPEINPGINLINKCNFPVFRFIVVMGCVSDFIYNFFSDRYVQSFAKIHNIGVKFTGKWHSSTSILPEHSITIQLPESGMHIYRDNISILVSFAIQFGEFDSNGEPVETNTAANGTILRVF